MKPRREARLRRAFAMHYPYLEVERWESAAVLADRVVAHTLGRPDGRFITGERALDPEHFEFRGWDTTLRISVATRREDGSVHPSGR
jgi:hypothetical protein